MTQQGAFETVALFSRPKRFLQYGKDSISNHRSKDELCVYVIYMHICVFLIFYFEIIIDSQEVAKKCPGRSQVDKTLTANTGDMGSVAGPGKFHMLQIPHALGHRSPQATAAEPRASRLCCATREACTSQVGEQALLAAARENLHTVTKTK